VDRALMSAAANLAGLYPPSADQKWNNKLGNVWQPIPIHSIPRDLDEVKLFEYFMLYIINCCFFFLY